MINNKIVFKGTKAGLYILLKEESSIDEIKEQMDRKIKPAKTFFEGAKIINFKGKSITEQEFMELRDIVENQYGMKVVGGYDIAAMSSYSEEDSLKNHTYAFESNDGDIVKGLYIRGTIRSGQLIRHNSNITIIGDVNPGAHLEAGASIMVMGNLRGTAHAGFGGKYDAYIAAHRLEPMQLRIGDIIARSPDGEQYKSNIPEIAIVKHGMIIIEPIK